MMIKGYISIHHSAPIRNKEYKYKSDYLEFIHNLKVIHRKRLIKDIILMIVFGVVMVFRAYVFLEYGI